MIHYLPLRGKFRGSINEHKCSYFYIYSDKTLIISPPMRIEHTNPNRKSQSEILYMLTGLLYQSKCSKGKARMPYGVCFIPRQNSGYF